MRNSAFDRNKHYYVLMRPLTNCLGICYKSSLSKEMFVECVIDESLYTLDEGYKVTFRALDEHYGTETYYQSTAEDLLKNGYIAPIEGGTSIKQITWAEPLTENLNKIN